MKVFGNILWMIFTGIESAFLWGCLGVYWCATLIGIPFGIQCFKLVRLYAWPFGTKVRTRFGAHPFLNIIWLIFGGAESAALLCFAGLLWCVTVVGVPFGKQCFKLARLSLFPFGAEFEK